MLLDKIKSDPGGVVLRSAVVVTDGLSVYPRQGSTGRHIRIWHYCHCYRWESLPSLVDSLL